jgi:hypothetical protein
MDPQENNIETGCKFEQRSFLLVSDTDRFD